MIELHSLEAEHGVIGAMLIQPHLIDVISEGLVGGDFYWAQNDELFRLIITMRDEQQPIDVITLSERKPILVGDIGTMAYAGEIQKNTPSAANAKSYARIVKERSMSRSLLSASTEIADLAHDQLPIEDKIAQAQSIILGLDGNAQDNECQMIGDILRDHVDVLQARCDRQGEIDGLTTGIKDLDENLKGLKPGQMVVIAGRPAMGKTTIAMNIAEHAVLSLNKPVLMVSLEMSKSQLLDRLLAAVGKIPLSSIKDGSVAADHGQNLVMATGKLMNANLVVCDTPSMTIPRVRSVARRMKHRLGGMGLVVIDYLQLIEGEGNGRTEDVSAMSRQVKLMARELECPVIVLSQLNRGCEQRPDKRPVLSDLRESGAIEQDADIVMFVYRDEVYHPNSEHKGIAEILVRKNRDGETGVIRTAFLGKYSRFAQLSAASVSNATAGEEGW